MNGEGMTLLSWVYMLVAWGIITGINVYCFYRVFTKKDNDPPD